MVQPHSAQLPCDMCTRGMATDGSTAFALGGQLSVSWRVLVGVQWLAALCAIQPRTQKSGSCV